MLNRLGLRTQTYIKKRETKISMESIEGEALIQKLADKGRAFFKKNCPQILKPGDCRSTKVFHGEHFFFQMQDLLASCRLSTFLSTLT